MADNSFNLPLQQTPDFESPPPTGTSHHDAYTSIAPSGNNHNHHVAGQAHAHAAAQPMPPMTGATVYTPTSAPSSELNPRSCVTCRRRKVRCDKLMPCSNCRRAMVPCIFPAPERAPRRPRRKDPIALKPHQSSEREIELLKRLRKLEGIVEDLSGQVEMEATSGGKLPASNSNSPEAAAGGSSSDSAGPRTSLDHGATPSASSSWGQSPKLAHAAQGSSANSPGRLVGRNSSYGSLMKQQTKDTQKQLGRLMINDYGRSRYVSSAFWSKINDEVCTFSCWLLVVVSPVHPPLPY